MKPSIGRIVHYVAANSINPVAAIITAVWSNTCVNLRLFQDGSNTQPQCYGEWQTSRSLDESINPAVGTWHWPPKV
jgi:hypothetical protein